MSEKQNEQNQFNAMVLVPGQRLERMDKLLLTMYSILKDMPTAKPTLNGMIGGKFIPETTAKEMLGKGTTWFWQMRKAGKLEYKKVGSKIYYVVDDLEKLIEGGDHE